MTSNGEHLKEYQFTSNQDREKASLAGKKSVQVKKELRQEAKKLALALEMTLGKAAPIGLNQLVEKIKSGELDAKTIIDIIKFYGDYTGQKPTEKLESDVEVKITRKSI